MEEIRLGAVELRFAELIWAHSPIASGELVKLCQRELAGIAVEKIHDLHGSAAAVPAGPVSEHRRSGDRPA